MLDIMFSRGKDADVVLPSSGLKMEIVCFFETLESTYESNLEKHHRPSTNGIYRFCTSLAEERVMREEPTPNRGNTQYFE